MGYRTRIIKAFTFLGGLYFFLEFILPAKIGTFELAKYDQAISYGFTAVVSMAVGLGLINLVAVHGSKIAFLRKGWFHSIALLFGLVLMIVVTVKDWVHTSRISEVGDRLLMLHDFGERIESDSKAQVFDEAKTADRVRILKLEALKSIDEASVVIGSERDRILDSDEGASNKLTDTATIEGQVRAALSQGKLEITPEFLGKLSALGLAFKDIDNLLYKRSLIKNLYTFLYDGMFVALGSAMFSLLAFYMAAAAYRAFRIRSAESALMMTAALLVMLGQIPFGIWIWDGFPEVRLWLLSVPSTAAFRAIKLGAAVAGVIIAFRMWFSIEAESFGDRRS